MITQVGATPWEVGYLKLADATGYLEIDGQRIRAGSSLRYEGPYESVGDAPVAAITCSVEMKQPDFENLPTHEGLVFEPLHYGRSFRFVFRNESSDEAVFQGMG